MSTHRFILALLFLSAVRLVAADDGGAEAKLREGLRNTMLQLRDAQGQIANLQSQAAIDGQKLKEAQAKIDALTKQAVEDRKVSTNTISELTTRLDEQKTLITGFEAAIAKWKTSYSELTTLAQKKEVARATQEARAIKAERRVEDQQIKNIQMYKIGMEILDRYEKFSLGDALLAREPFIGTTKVKLQTLVQNDQDKLTDSRIKP